MPSQIPGVPLVVADINDNTAKALVNPQSSGAPVEYIRPELAARLPTYEKIRDVIAGQEVVKSKAYAYLPEPDVWASTVGINYATARYNAYRLRAVFYGVTGRTLAGLTGQVSLKPATIKVPTSLDLVVKDATGTGISLEKLGVRCVSEVLQLGRIGLYADYPVREGDKPTTVAEQQEGEVRPTISMYPAEDCINWQVSKRGARSVLSLVVLRETYDESTDGFKVEKKPQFRVLRLEPNGIVSVEVWRNPGTWTAEAKVYPKDGKGVNLNEIPFIFIGAQDNDPSIDPAPLEDLAELNLAHYRNSADYEEGVFITGQPTPVISGIEQSWWENVLEKQIRFGSRSGIPLPADASLELVQADPNSAAYEAMTHKEEQMKALGAKLVEVTSVQKTATESTQNEISETSVLTGVVNNVSSGVLWCLEWCAIFSGNTTINRDEKDADKKLVNFVLNTDFDFKSMTSDEINAAISAWQMGAISFTEMRTSIRKSGLATQQDDEAKAAIEAEKMDNISKFGDPNNPDNPNNFNADGSRKPGTEKDPEEDEGEEV